MENPHDMEQRLTELEIKASFNEDLLDQLEQVIIRQQQQIDLLLRQVGQLQSPEMQLEPGAARNPREDLPPHY
jgi:SlyX protein